MIPATNYRQQRTSDRRAGEAHVCGGCGRPSSAASNDVQNRPTLRGRAGFSFWMETPPRGGFIVSSLNLGRAYGLGSLSRRFTSSRLQFHRIGYQPGSDFPDPLERHVRHSKSVGFNTDELMRGKAQNAGISVPRTSVAT